MRFTLAKKKFNPQTMSKIIHIKGANDKPELLSIEELQNRLRSGQLSGEEYSWQDGWDEWRQISSVDEFHPPDVSHSSQILDSPPCVPEPSEDANKSKSAFAGISILTFIFVIIGAVMGKDCAQNSTGNNSLPTYTTPTNKHNPSAYQDLEANLRKVADRLNRDLPKLVDKETRLELTKSGPGREFTYMYTLVNMYASDINRRDFAANMRSHLLQSYKSEPGMKYFRDNNVKVHYIYVDPDASTIALISISPEEF